MEGEDLSSDEHINEDQNSGDQIIPGEAHPEGIKTGVVHTVFKLEKAQFDRQKVLENILNIFPGLQ